MKKYFLLPLLFILPLSVFAFDARFPEVKILKTNMVEKKTFSAFSDNNQSGGSIAIGDLGIDGKAEIVIGSGPDQEPWVYIYRSDGKLKRKFLAYDVNSKMGVNVAIGNVRGKKTGKRVRNEIITSPMVGGGPEIKVFNKKGEYIYNSSFNAFEENYKGGVNIAACDTNGNGRDEILTASGAGMRSHVKSFDSRGVYLGLDYYPFAEYEQGGVTIACANVDGGDEDEVIMGIQSFGKSLVKVYKTSPDKKVLGQFFPYGESFKGGVQVAGGDIDKDGEDEIITAPTQGGGPHIKVYEGHGDFTEKETIVYENDFCGGVKIASGLLTKKKKVKKTARAMAASSTGDQIAALPASNSIEGRTDLYKYIDVNLTEQRLTAYENGVKKYDYLVSTGKSGYNTPIGEFPIYAKVASQTMAGFYGEDDPENYELENVPHVLAFYGDYTIHGAYWHNNWGHVMSHGCVNEPLYEAGLLYDWADVGDLVVVHY